MVHTLNLAELAGHVGSNPRLVSSFPQQNVDEKLEKFIVSNCLPDGILPSEISTSKYEGKTFLSYCFKKENKNTRDDLLALSIVVDLESTNMLSIIDDNKLDFNELKKVYEEICKQLIESGIDIEQLITSLEDIFQGIKNESKITLDDIEINVSDIIDNALRRKSPKKKKKMKKKKEKTTTSLGDKFKGRII